MAGTTPGRRGYHYNGLATNIVLNYVIHKSGSRFQDLMNTAFRDAAGTSSTVFFFRNRGYRADDGAAWYQFYATRDDYLRIARAMLEAWQGNTCVGQYLKQVYNGAQSKGQSNPDRFEKFQSARSYGGFFHVGYPGMERRAVMGMDGYGGQAILIDFDLGRIVVMHAAHIDYDWFKMGPEVIRTGRLP